MEKKRVSDAEEEGTVEDGVFAAADVEGRA
jgi:hypothetical protein